MLNRQQGLTLVELMIGIAIGMMAIAAVSGIYQITAIHSRKQLAYAHLYSTLQHILTLLEADIRRSGYRRYRPGVDRIADNPFQLPQNDLRVGAYPDEPGASCLLLAYDVDDDGKVGIGACRSSDCPAWSDEDNVEQFGYRLRDGALQMRASGGRYACDESGWQALTETRIEVSTFQVRIDARCRNLTDANAGCDANGDKLWTRGVAIGLAAHWRGRPETELALRRYVRVRNDRLLTGGDA
jgi:prepilin peptidase dependent protein B